MNNHAIRYKKAGMTSGSHIRKKIKKYAAFIARADILFYALPWLMVLIVLGTVTQKELGLHVATEKYINALITWIGPVPVPGGLSVMALIFVALLIKFLFFSKWRFGQSGIIITHLGVLILLSGGLITASVSREGFMIIPEGQAVGEVSDYTNRTLVISSEENGEALYDFDDLKISQIIQYENLSMEVLEACQNCGARAPTGIYENLQGLAVNMELYAIAPEKNIEANFSGLIFKATQENSDDQNGTYIIMEDIPKNPIFKNDADEITVALSRAKMPLPFSIYLDDFRKIDYAGTQKAREFESDLIIRDQNLSWPVTISMNEPLRYKGYSFYQSSFEQRDGFDVTVLSVVKNAGWIFPYISTLIIFAGLVLHIIIRLTRKGRTS